MKSGSSWRFLLVDNFLAPIIYSKGMLEHQLRHTLRSGTTAYQTLQLRMAEHHPLALPLHGWLDAFPHT